MRLCLLALLLVSSSLAQHSPEETLRLFLNAFRAGDRTATLAQMSANPIVYSPGGSTLPVGTVGPRLWSSFTGRIVYLRHIVDVTPDSAVAILIWRQPAAPPGYTAGATDVMLRKEGDIWKVFSWRDASVNQPRNLPVTHPAGVGADGWRMLLDGKSTAGWTTVDGNAHIPEGWQLHDGILSTVPSQRRISLRTEEEFTAFELRWEWRAAANANSGVLYELFAEDGGGNNLAGIEYQIADDDGDPGAKIDDRQKSGAQYGVAAVLRRASKPLGEWNESRILIQGNHCQHWLNGIKTAEFTVDGVFPSPISLQQHGPGVDFRSVRIRPIPEK
jgi:hypothetical protein